jgi:hypothetical protein
MNRNQDFFSVRSIYQRASSSRNAQAWKRMRAASEEAMRESVAIIDVSLND